MDRRAVLGALLAGVTACCLHPAQERPTPGKDSCKAACVIGGVGHASDELNSQDACQSCRPFLSNSQWSQRPAGSPCGAGAGCDSDGVCVTVPGCNIGGHEYQQGEANPADPSQCCSPTRTKAAWVDRLQDAGLYQIGGFPPLPAPDLFHVTGLAAGDFNQDGRVDLAIAGNSSVSILLARGDGTFSAPTVYQVCGQAISAGDLNGDGAPDLVAAGCGDGIDVLMNQADGTGRLTVVHRTFSTVMGARFFPPLQDLDGDCILDLALPGWAAFFLKGLGDGGFAEPVTYPLPGGAGAMAWGMAAGRLQDTGGVDLVMNTTITSNEDPSYKQAAIRLLLGNGDGTFALGQVLPVAADAVAIGDFNGDGIADLAENTLVGPLAIYLGHGDGTLGSPVSYLEGGTGFVTLADLDGDGKAEALSANSSRTDAAMTVLWHVRDGGVLGTSLPVGNQPPGPGVPCACEEFPILAADLDGDGTPEVVVGSVDIGSGTVNIFSNGCP